jgi:hypothetical protein
MKKNVNNRKRTHHTLSLMAYHYYLPEEGNLLLLGTKEWAISADPVVINA